MNKKDEAYFNVAKAVSETSDFPKQHIGCAVVYKHRIISSGCNCKITHPMQKALNKERFTNDTLHHWKHAELSALLPIMNSKNIEWSKVKLYIYRELKDGTKANARPCPSCQRLIRDLGIKKIFYTSDNGYIQEIFD